MRRNELDYILSTMLDFHKDVSDLVFTVDKPFQVEAAGQLTTVPIQPNIERLTPYHTEMIALNLLGGSQRLTDDLLRTGSCDASYSLGDRARFRVNVFSQRGYFSIVLRKLNAQIPSISDLTLPEVILDAAKEKTGLVLVTGATGSGKSTTLAALINEINHRSAIHIITLEDPVEFVYRQQKSTINQRELGTDFDSFSTGLRAALRQAPKVILVGEIRDRETMEIALTAAETGHIVYSTLHTISAAQSVNRVIGMFTNEEEVQIRQRLADTLRYVVSQRLAPKVGGGRVLVSEIMGSNLRTREAVLLGENEIRDFHDIIESNYQNGWHSFEQSLLKLFRENKITEDTAMLYSVNKPAMRKAIDVAKKSMLPEDDTPSGFRLNLEALHVAPGTTHKPA